jgi:hypothetical protein
LEKASPHWYVYDIYALNKPDHITVPSLLKRWKRLESGLNLSAEAFFNLNDRFGDRTKVWLKADQLAQRTRGTNPEAMDIYDMNKEHGMNINFPL